jgi:ribosomal protein S12
LDFDAGSPDALACGKFVHRAIAVNRENPNSAIRKVAIRILTNIS